MTSDYHQKLNFAWQLWDDLNDEHIDPEILKRIAYQLQLANTIETIDNQLKELRRLLLECYFPLN